MRAVRARVFFSGLLNETNCMTFFSQLSQSMWFIPDVLDCKQNVPQYVWGESYKKEMINQT